MKMYVNEVLHDISKTEHHFLSNCLYIKLTVFSFFLFLFWGDTGVRGLTRVMTTFPQGNQEPLLVVDKVGRPPSEFGVRKSIECDTFPFSALTLLVGQQ